jgi:hypothetical protein
MPFLQILWDPEQIGEDRIVRVRDLLMDAVGPALMAVDPQHIVNSAMVDARLVAIGPLDRIRAPLFVTLFARTETDRVAGSATIIEGLTAAVAGAIDASSTVVELVLTDHHSSFDYVVHE